MGLASRLVDELGMYHKARWRVIPAAPSRLESNWPGLAGITDGGFPINGKPNASDWGKAMLDHWQSKL
ncbi:hypothetical protein PCASD_01541 [Puccinia coronata f. sp. avenae]|uniref:Uncharacterized protein n=1 Tax=Puccinia coronata f. sp. avenae TaxID=200324 RepID=A0A2N5TG01_9BASI|nr:hypothetical protein PCASD_06535 [Puccinia coronata f. sp. avenae]PLW49767.1 hypothetical protein PCASD_01541 [Puccinia coronata f. sp. avenae]